ERGDEHDPEDQQHQEQRDQPLELLPKRVSVLGLEDALPELRERHFEPAPPHLDDVGADREHGRPNAAVRPKPEWKGPEEAHRRKPPDRKILRTSWSNAIDVCVRKNGSPYFEQ